MSFSIFDRICSLYNSVRQRLWPNDSLKRRRDSIDEDEEDDIFMGYQTLSKRAKWMKKPKMASNNDTQYNSPVMGCSSQQKTQRNVRQMQNSATKENGNEVEVIEIEDDDHQPVESRAPLTDLSIKAKPMNGAADGTYSLNVIKALDQTNRKSNVHTDRRKNGVNHLLFQNSFTTPLRLSKHASTSKQTALNETLKADDQRKYSVLLSEYHRSACAAKHKTQDNHTSRQNCPLQNSLKTMPSFSKSIDTHVPRQEAKKYTRVPVKPFQSPASDDDDVEIVEDRSVPCVNSLEKKLSQNRLVSPEWITEMQKKYREREREARRQLEEAKLKKELYAQHNQSKRIEALDERIRKHLQITDVVLEDVEEIPKLPELTAEINAKIDSALKPNPPSEVLVEGFGQLIRRLDMKTLSNLNWLNDEVINFYMNLIVERGKEGGKYPKVYAFNTFFYPKLVSQGYNSLKRWTKKVDIFDHELLLVPIHLGMHWCMAVIDFRDKSVRYYDSMGSVNNRCLNALLKYLNEESLDKKKKAFSTSNWSTENVKDIPQQMNGSDCGMFSCMFAEYLSRNAKFTFSQKDMPYFRRKMVYEIISKRLLQ